MGETYLTDAAAQSACPRLGAAPPLKRRKPQPRGNGMTYQEIADVPGISRQRVQQIEREALEKLHQLGGA